MKSFYIKYSNMDKEIENIILEYIIIEKYKLKHIIINLDFEDQTHIPDDFVLYNKGGFDTELGSFDLIIKGDKLTHIGDNFMDNCHDLKKITLPKNLTHIGDKFLNKCPSLKKINTPIKLKDILDGIEYINCEISYNDKLDLKNEKK